MFFTNFMLKSTNHVSKSTNSVLKPMTPLHGRRRSLLDALINPQKFEMSRGCVVRMKYYIEHKAQGMPSNFLHLKTYIRLIFTGGAVYKYGNAAKIGDSS